MRVLVACEESQVVAAAFRLVGAEAWSCDVVSPSGGHPEWHLQGDVLGELEGGWDALIGFPPCTHLCSSGARWWPEKQRDGRQQAALAFFRTLADAPIPYVALENPVGIVSSLWRPPDQIIQPWQFGHGEVKTTCLWLKGLPCLTPTEVAEGREQRAWKMPQGPERSRLRSKTYPGIAMAMAEQWAPFIRERRHPVVNGEHLALPW